MTGPFLENVGVLAQASRETPFDAIIVGGGSSGLAVAATLAEAGRRAVVVEAGPAVFLTHVQNTTLRYSAALGRMLRDTMRYRPAMPDGEFFGTNFSCLGGRGLFWNGAAPRFAPHDFAGWPSAAIPSESDYQWAESQFLVTRRFGETALAQRIVASLASNGLAAEPGPYAVEPGAAPNLGLGISSAFGFFFRIAGAALTAGHVRIATETTVDRVIVEQGATRGVVVSADGLRAEIRGRSVVLAGGGIESIKLAALSQISDPAERIGKGLQEHIFYNALLDAPGHYDAAQPDTAIVYVRSPETYGHQWELHAPGNRMFAIDDGTPWRPAAGAAYQIMIRSFAATEKRDANRVEARPGGLGSALVHFAHSDRDRARMEKMTADAVRVAAALGGAAPDGVPLDSIGRIRAPGSSYHEAGGLDMGEDPGTSVTDPQGMFHRVDGLLCVDAASFPHIGATNPHLTLLASARRKALALAERLVAA